MDKTRLSHAALVEISWHAKARQSTSATHRVRSRVTVVEQSLFHPTCQFTLLFRGDGAHSCTLRSGLRAMDGALEHCADGSTEFLLTTQRYMYHQTDVIDTEDMMIDDEQYASSDTQYSSTP